MENTVTTELSIYLSQYSGLNIDISDICKIIEIVFNTINMYFTGSRYLKCDFSIIFHLNFKQTISLK